MYSVLYENDNFLIVSKSSGVLVHKTNFEFSDNLIDEINSNWGADYFLVNRIDRFTSGIVLIAKNRRYLKLIQQLFSENKVEKNYLAILSKELPAKRVKICLSIGRSKGNKLMFSNRNAKNYKPAVTEAVELQGKFVSLKLITGRTHQIRAHLCDIGCPILNDPVYGKELFNPKFGQFLHSYKVKFVCPLTGGSVEVTAPLPIEFMDLLKEMGIDKSKYE